MNLRKNVRSQASGQPLPHWLLWSWPRISNVTAIFLSQLLAWLFNHLFTAWSDFIRGHQNNCATYRARVEIHHGNEKHGTFVLQLKPHSSVRSRLHLKKVTYWPVVVPKKEPILWHSLVNKKNNPKTLLKANVSEMRYTTQQKWRKATRELSNNFGMEISEENLNMLEETDHLRKCLAWKIKAS